MIKSTGNLAIQKFWYLANWIFHSAYDFVGGGIRQAAALGFLGSKVPKKLKRRVELWMTGEQLTSMSPMLVVESEQLLSVVRTAHYYVLRKARYPENRAEDMRRQEIELPRSTTWTLAWNEAAALDANGYPCSGYWLLLKEDCYLSKYSYRYLRFCKWVNKPLWITAAPLSYQLQVPDPLLSKQRFSSAL